MKNLVVFLFFSFVYSRCPENTIQGPGNSVQGPSQEICVKFLSSPLTASMALTYCIGELGGMMVSVHNAFENEWLRNMSKIGLEENVDEFWLGGVQPESSAPWGWQDNSEFNYNNWDKGQPSGLLPLLCIAQNTKTGLWRADSCWAPKPYACRIPQIVQN